MSDNQVDLRPPMPPPPAPLKEKSTFDLTNPSFALVIYNFLVAIPFAYTIAILNKRFVQYLGYEKIMRCPSGILGTRLLFVAVNLFLVIGWAKQMRDENWAEKEARMGELRRQVEWWDGEILRLEAALGIERVRTPALLVIWFCSDTNRCRYKGDEAESEEGSEETDTKEQKKQRQLAEAAALEQAETEFEQQLRIDALLAKDRGSPDSKNGEIPTYERDSVVNEDGIREWDFVVGAKSQKGKEFAGSRLKGLSLGSAGSRLPKLRKKKGGDGE
ncbi:uncharacterized protein PAC_07153 [Phialocephala subalpina]|uniref:Uncharacterized protein n=1 Tax=Phialocephala subalpina TaxID=576137 RepID=A0A1L7WWX1_9HELO|nr:uncharacterized protein PAC_07153 [Phialocephala subalpina]